MSKAESFAKYHDEHARFGGASREFHERAGSYIRAQAERIEELEGHVAAAEARGFERAREQAAQLVRAERDMCTPGVQRVPWDVLDDAEKDIRAMQDERGEVEG